MIVNDELLMDLEHVKSASICGLNYNRKALEAGETITVSVFHHTGNKRIRRYAPHTRLKGLASHNTVYRIKVTPK